jgi:hypothetical protein
MRISASMRRGVPGAHHVLPIRPILHVLHAFIWACALAASLPAVAHAGDGDRAAAAHTAAGILRDASAALDAGEHQRAADLARGVLANPDVPAPDRAEAWRLFGLASFFLERFPDAEEAFLAYLKVEVDGRLDPAVVPPEAIVFFEDVRARHAAELRKYRPGPERRRYRALNLLPPAGQFQNGQPTKGWVIAGLGSLALATNIGTYVTLRRWCEESTGVCRSGGESRTDSARTMRTVNMTAGVVFVGTVLYGMYDGFRHFRPNRPRARTSVQLVPSPDGAFASIRILF